MATGPSYGSGDPIKAGQEGVAFLVNQASRAFYQRMSPEIRQFNIQMPGYVVLRHVLREIEAAPEGVLLTELARKLLLDQQAVVDASARLERDGWLRASGLGAATRVRPTAKAYKIAPVLAAASRWMLEEALNGFSREEIDQLTTLLKRLLRNMDAPLGSDEGPLEP